MGVKQEDITDQKFGMLTAVSWSKNQMHITKSGKKIWNNFWEFRCDCGVSKVLRKGRVKPYCRTSIKSCGCCRSLTGSESSNWKGCGEITGTFWSIVERNARIRDLVLGITIEQAWEKFQSQNGICALSGVKISFKERTASLDRIDSDEGYTISNVQWTHKVVNCMKWDMPESEFFDWCEIIAFHQRRLI